MQIGTVSDGITLNSDGEATFNGTITLPAGTVSGSAQLADQISGSQNATPTDPNGRACRPVSLPACAPGPRAALIAPRQRATPGSPRAGERTGHAADR